MTPGGKRKRDGPEGAEGTNEKVVVRIFQSQLYIFSISTFGKRVCFQKLKFPEAVEPRTIGFVYSILCMYCLFYIN